MGQSQVHFSKRINVGSDGYAQGEGVFELDTGGYLVLGTELDTSQNHQFFEFIWLN